MNIEMTNKTPEIVGSVEDGTLTITGKSLPEDAGEFYAPILSWIEELAKSTDKPIVATQDIEYMNTSSALFIMRILDSLKNIGETKPVKISWVYEEDDYEMQTAGENYQHIIGDIVELVMKAYEEE